MGNDQFRLRLLPTYYKKVGFGIMILSVLIVILSKTLIIDKEIGLIISKASFLISLLILALTKNKIEDELTLRIRLHAFVTSFLFGVVLVIFDLFMKLYFRDGSSLLSDNEPVAVLVFMFFTYFFRFHHMIYNR